ncbi:MAG: PAS domain-containing protein, partial [Proteobacteria bacterium]
MLRDVFDTIETGCCIVELLFDPEGLAVDHRYLYVNAAFEKHTGIANALGRRVQELVPHFEARWHAIYSEVLRTGVPDRVVEQT